jgi:uncharacterized protein YggU (UPF0235/DUF167 family)
MFDILRSQLKAAGTIDLRIRVRPHSAKTQYVRTLADGSMKIDIAAPAEDNRGNIELVRFLADALDVAISNVTILSGKTARLKLVRVKLEIRNSKSETISKF